VGFDSAAYAQRDPGASPDRVRDGMWSIVGEDVSGAVLDAGSGGGDWLRRLQTSVGSRITRLASVDIVDSGASTIPHVEFHQADLAHEPLPFGDATFDWIFGIEVIEHLANPRYFVRQAARVLKTGGRLALSTPSNDSINSRLSLLLRGYYPLFSDAAYHASGHITPLLEIDLRRIAGETGLKIEFFYPCDGHIPRTNIKWQRLWPGLRGKYFTDALFCIMSK
jgi:SAM-dependent methyltransferase